MKNRLIRLVLFLLLACGIALVIANRERFDAALLEQWIQQAGLAGPIIFMLIYAIGTVLFLPGSVITLAGGALFGPLLGTFLNLTGATLGATLAFLAARYLASDWVEQKTAGRLQQLKQGVENEGWRFVAFVRLVPLFPFNLLNYALGLTRIKLSHYIIASYICMLPGGFAYTYLGYAGREAVAGSEGLIQKAILALALLATVAFLPRLIRQLRRGRVVTVAELEHRLDGQEELLVLDVGLQNTASNTGQIPQANHIPLEQLRDHLQELSSQKDKTVYLLDQDEQRARQAAQILTAQGFREVHVVKR